VSVLTLLCEDDSDDEAVDAEHSRHDHGDDVLHDGLAVDGAHARDAHAALQRAVSSSEVCRDTEERHGQGW
jgi:hypothetical protein